MCDDNSLIFTSSVNPDKPKEVYLAQYDGKQVVMKSLFASIHQTPPAIPLSGLNIHDSLAKSQHLVEQAVKLVSSVRIFTIKDNGTVFLHRLWMPDMVDLFEETTNPTTLQSLMNNFLNLLHQREYVVLKLLQGSKHIPALIGTCGHFYVTESSPSSSIINIPYRLNIVNAVVNRASTQANWSGRASAALHVLDLVKHFDTGFPEIINHCDIVGRNLGFSQVDGTIKAIDVDSVFFDSSLKKLLEKPKIGGGCSKNTDCDRFHCKGWCDVRSHQCQGVRTNNNLQVSSLRKHVKRVLHNFAKQILEP